MLLFATQMVPPLPTAMPQGLTRFASVRLAAPGMSEQVVGLVCRQRSRGDEGEEQTSQNADLANELRAVPPKLRVNSLHDDSFLLEVIKPSVRPAPMRSSHNS